MVADVAFFHCPTKDLHFYYLYYLLILSKKWVFLISHMMACNIHVRAPTTKIWLLIMPFNIVYFTKIAFFFKELISQFPVSYPNVLFKRCNFSRLTLFTTYHWVISPHLHLKFPETLIYISHAYLNINQSIKNIHIYM